MPGSTKPSITPGSPTFRWAASSSRAFLPTAFLAVGSLARAQAPFEVSGALLGSEEAVSVRVDVKNTSDENQVGVRVSGDLLGRHAAGNPVDIVAGRTAGAVLVFPYASEWRPGRHVLPLSIDYVARGGQRLNLLAYLVLPIAQPAEPALRVTAPVTRLDIRCRLPVRLDSADGQPHRARVRVLTPRGLIAPDPPPVVEVPSQGGVMVEIALLHGAAPPESRQGILIVAESLEGPIEHAAVGTSAVDIAADPAWLAHARAPLFVLTLILLLAGGIAERHRLRS